MTAGSGWRFGASARFDDARSTQLVSLDADKARMAVPIQSISHRDYSWPDQPSDRDDFRETIVRHANDANYGICREPTTVIGGVLCDDRTAVSNACRRAGPGTFDEFVCDDPALQKAQKWFEDLARKAIELVFGAKLGRPK